MTEHKTGTREWSDWSVNCYRGCSNACLYCYARENALRYGRIATGADWANEVINEKAVAKGYGRRKGRGMFPTTHDITESNVDACITVLRKLLAAGNEMLVVSKPDPAVMYYLHRILAEWKSQVMFRFSIGDIDDGVLRFWEPNAPTLHERYMALADAFQDGWQTSVSMEPFLGDPETIVECVETFAPYVTDTIWVGTLNKPAQRLRWCLHDNYPLEEALRGIELAQTDEQILENYERLKHHPKVVWKGSYKAVLRKHGITIDEHGGSK